MIIGMPHRRSFEAMQRRAARRLILEMAYKDRLRSEVVNRLSMAEIMDYLSKMFGGRIHLGAVPKVEAGEVLADSRGQGSFQRRFRHES